MENKLNYIPVGDYYMPDLQIPKEERSIGKWGRMHRDYLKEYHPIRYNELVLSGKLWTYLADMNQQAQERVETIVSQLKAAEGVTEALKARNPLFWVQQMNSIQTRAEEIVLRELVYEEAAV